MRVLAGLVVVALGCGAGTPTVQAPTAGLMSSDEFATRISGLRATLARSGVEIDTDPVVDSCTSLHRGEQAASGCSRCEVATRDNTAGIDPDLIDGVAIAFAFYTPAMLAASKLQHVALCRTIRIDGDERPPAGIAIPQQHRVLISLEQVVDSAPAYKDFTVEQVVHHEVFHLFDFSTGEGFARDLAWNALNPRGFAYQDPAVDVDQRPAGFVNRYGTTNEMEDRATVFEYLIGQPDLLCQIAHADPVVAAKAAAVWKRVAKVTGDRLLRQHAPCVDWIGKKPRPAKPAPKRSPKQPVDLRLRGE